MNVIATFSVSASSFTLAQTFEEAPGITVEIERLATHSREWVMPFMWVSGEKLEVFETALENDPTVTDFRCIEKGTRGGLYNIFWHENVAQMIDRIADQHGIMLEIEGHGGEWTLKLRFLDQRRLADFQAYFDKHGYSFTLEHLYQPTGVKQREFDLTPEQRDTLLVAQESGYFKIPRDVSTAELATRFDISSNAVSQRLRRGMDTLIENTLRIRSHQDTDSDESDGGRSDGRTPP